MSNKDYYSPILCLGAKQRTPSPSSVAFYDMPGKVWAASIFFVPVLAREIGEGVKRFCKYTTSSTNLEQKPFFQTAFCIKFAAPHPLSSDS